MKCNPCPLRDRPEPCPAITTGHRRYCELMDPARPDHNADYGPLLIAMATGAATALPSVASPDLAADLARRALILECDYLGPPSGCGCQSLRVCFAGKGRSPGGGPGPDVAPSDCLACVSSWSWP